MMFEYLGWQEVADLNTVRSSMGDTGTLTSALAAGGAPGNKTDTEEWSGTSDTTRTVSTD